MHLIRSAVANNPSPATIFCIDGAEQLGRWRWWQTLQCVRPFGGMIITGHREGRLPTLLTTQSSIDLLSTLVSELVPEDLFKLEPIVARIFERNRGNIRTCFQDLYDLYAGRMQPNSN
ncbi:MAG: hypothetical protein GY906_16535 [bacterium]|nr:hypothetical protein [bacterium]